MERKRNILQQQNVRWQTNKTVVFGIMDGNSWRGRPAREWLKDIQDCCGVYVHDLNTAQNRSNWQQMIRCSCHTSGRWALESQEGEEEFTSLQKCTSTFKTLSQSRMSRPRMSRPLA